MSSDVADSTWWVILEAFSGADGGTTWWVILEVFSRADGGTTWWVILEAFSRADGGATWCLIWEAFSRAEGTWWVCAGLSGLIVEGDINASEASKKSSKRPAAGWTLTDIK